MNFRRLAPLASLSLITLVLNLSHPVAAAPGDLDPSFGNNGRVEVSIGDEDRVGAVVEQPDGKFVVAGWTRRGTSVTDFALARFNSDGGLDTSFGSGGSVLTSIGYNDQAHALLLQPDNKLVAVGAVTSSGGAVVSSAAVRYNPDGSLDNTFGAGGIVETLAGGGYAAALQPDGKILLAGGGGDSSTADFKVTRLNADGSIDTTFINGGFAVIDFAGSGDGVYGLALQDDGKIIAGGRSRVLGGDDNFALARLNVDGSLDSSFGVGGKVTTDFAHMIDFGFAVTMQADGKIILVGQANVAVNNWDYGLVRYNPDGSLDSSFGVGGKVTTDFGGVSDAAFAVKVQNDGKIVVTGRQGGVATAFGTARYQVNGSLDPTFGNNGKVSTFFEVTDEAHGLVIQPDGKIVVAGLADGGATIGQFALARYFGDGAANGLQLLSAVSRKTHSSAGVFDIPLPLGDTPGVESRDGRGRYTLLLSFSNTIVAGNASVTSGNGVVVGQPKIRNNVMTVNLNGVTGVQTLTVTASDVMDDAGQVLASAAVSMGVLIGDVTIDRVVNNADVALTNSQRGAILRTDNFREDVNVDGVIDSTDVRQVRQRVGNRLP